MQYTTGENKLRQISEINWRFIEYQKTKIITNALVNLGSQRKK